MGIGIYTIASFMITKVLSQRIGRLTMSKGIQIGCTKDGCAQITVGCITLTDTCVPTYEDVSQSSTYVFNFRMQSEREDPNHSLFLIGNHDYIVWRFFPTAIKRSITK